MPLLPVTDVAKTLEYLQKLGFAADFNSDNVYASASRDGKAIHVTSLGDRKGLGDTGVFLVVEGLDELKKEFESAGVHVGEVRETPYQMREFDLKDPDGNMLAFAEQISP